MPTNTVSIYSATHRGLKRRGNEDAHAWCSDIGLCQWHSSHFATTATTGGAVLILADGMGGARAGEIASALAVESIQSYLCSLSSPIDRTNSKQVLASAIQNAHQAIIMHQHEHRKTMGMGTTMVVAWIYYDYIALAWVGDSRAYRYNQHTGLEALTRDHSMVQKLIDMGHITKEEAFNHPNQNIITQFVGDKLHIPLPDFIESSIGPDDIILLCSDGLTGMLREHHIGQILKGYADLKTVGEHLIKEANQAGGDDNITLILCDTRREGYELGVRS
jgi:PPM family protein phosphatase